MNLKFLPLAIFIFLASFSFAQKAIDFDLTDLNGNQHKLYADYLDKGIPVVIDISATWCGPCWNFHNSHILKRLYDKHGPEGDGKGMVMFVEGDPTTNKDCLYGPNGCNSSTYGDWTKDVPYPIVHEGGGQISEDFKLTGYPSIFLVKPDGSYENLYGHPFSFNFDFWSNELTKASTVGVNDELKAQNEKLNLFPNPANEKVYISLDGGNILNANLEIFSVDGKSVYTQSSFSASVLDVKDFEKGFYLLQLKQDDKIYVQKLIIE